MSGKAVLVDLVGRAKSRPSFGHMVGIWQVPIMTLKCGFSPGFAFNPIQDCQMAPPAPCRLDS